MAFAVLTLEQDHLPVMFKEARRKEASTVTYYGLKTIVEMPPLPTPPSDTALSWMTMNLIPHPSRGSHHPRSSGYGEAQGISGKEFLLAVIAGYDAMLRVGKHRAPW
jgi:hypothetical protein